MRLSGIANGCRLSVPWVAMEVSAVGETKLVLPESSSGGRGLRSAYLWLGPSGGAWPGHGSPSPILTDACFPWARTTNEAQLVALNQ